jgi:sulfoxide reductase heme-binding subunit YedZ
MSKLAALFSNRTVLWLILALPGIKLVWPFLTGGFIPSGFLAQSGEWAMRFLILTLALTPLQRLFRKSRFVYWLTRRRRYFGVASFFYAALHVGYYLWELIDAWGGTWLTRLLFNAMNLFAWSGWLAFAIYLPLALSSNRFSQARLGRWWKWLQRLTYLAAVAAAVHWLLLANTWQTWAQLGALATLEIVRLGLPLMRRPSARGRGGAR